MGKNVWNTHETMEWLELEKQPRPNIVLFKNWQFPFFMSSEISWLTDLMMPLIFYKKESSNVFIFKNYSINVKSFELTFIWFRKYIGYCKGPLCCDITLEPNCTSPPTFPKEWQSEFAVFLIFDSYNLNSSYSFYICIFENTNFKWKHTLWFKSEDEESAYPMQQWRVIKVMLNLWMPFPQYKSSITGMLKYLWH